jgi:hypothetical protein
MSDLSILSYTERFQVAKKKIPELNVEQVNDRANMLFISLLEYRREEYLCIIDNITSAEIGAYVLDYVDQEGIPADQFLSVAIEWFYSKSDKHPLSVEIARRGLTQVIAPIYRTFDTSYVSRIIGQAFTYDSMTKTKVRRRRVNAIPEGIPIRFKKTVAPVTA